MRLTQAGSQYQGVISRQRSPTYRQLPGRFDPKDPSLRGVSLKDGRRQTGLRDRRRHPRSDVRYYLFVQCRACKVNHET